MQQVVRQHFSSRRGPALVNRLHNFFGPPHRVRDCADGRRNSLTAIKLHELAGSKDTLKSTRLRASSTADSLSYSLFLRHGWLSE